jgi:transmembrane sensor
LPLFSKITAMTDRAPLEQARSVIEEAAEWHGRLADAPDDQELRTAVDAWKTADPAHMLAFADVEIAHATARSMAETPELLALRHETLGRLVASRQTPWRAIAASVALLVAIGGGWFGWQALRPGAGGAPQIAAVEPGLYRTGIGERLTVTLDDGSTAVLNTQSRLRVAYTATERRLVLETGQALFEVAKGQKRPFMVVAGDRTIVAHGTMFDVRLGGKAGVEVALIEGEVSVRNNAAPQSHAITLKPREVLSVTASAASVKPIAEPDQVVSWRDGMVVFENEDLTSAVAEMNRYSRQAIILEGDGLKTIRVSGAFRTGESGAFVEALQLSFPVGIAERTPEKIVLVPGRKPA